MRIARRTPRSLTFTGLLENDQVSGLPHVYNACCLIPAKFTGIKIPLLSSEKRSQMVPKDTDLGEVHAAEIVEEVANMEENPRKNLSPLERDAIDNIMKKIPKDKGIGKKGARLTGKVPEHYLHWRPRHRTDRSREIPNRYRRKPSYSLASPPPPFSAP